MTVAAIETPLSKELADDLATVAGIEVIPRILDVICRSTGLGFAAVARVTEDGWVACAVQDEIAFGLAPGARMRIETTLCNKVRESHQPIVINHVAEHPEFRDHPTPKQYGFQSYISVPILRPDGRFFGTLCAIDPRPAELSAPETLEMIQLFAQLIGMHLSSAERLARSETALVEAHHVAELREQFVAVLGHDLRNPLASIDMCAQHLLQTATLSQLATDTLRRMRKSVARMAGLIDNVLDFARGRLGSGIDIEMVEECDIGLVMEQILEEQRTLHPERQIESHFDLRRPVRCDSSRLGQLFANLLANAMTHGDPARPVRVHAASDGAGFVLAVSNDGPPIPPDYLARLFQPFARGTTPADAKGLGLGLFIASEIAKAHGGIIEVSSTIQETRFTFRMRAA